MLIKKSVIFTWYACNAKCVFCIDLNKRQINASTKTLFENIIQAKKSGTTYLEIIGWEITIRRDFFMILAFAKKVWFETIMFVTNGIKFADKSFCKRILDMNIVDHLVFSIHSHLSELHDELVAHKWAHDKLMAWIKNLRELGFNKIGINNTIIAQNYTYLPEFVEFLHAHQLNNIETIFADPNQGWVNNEFDTLMPKISLVAPFAQDAIRRANSYKMTFRIRYVPLCHFPEFIDTDNISEVMEVRTFKTAHIAPDFQNNDVAAWRKSVWRIKPEKCLPCKYYNICEWIWTTYYEKLWDDELHPIV